MPYKTQGKNHRSQGEIGNNIALLIPPYRVFVLTVVQICEKEKLFNLFISVHAISDH